MVEILVYLLLTLATRAAALYDPKMVRKKQFLFVLLIVCLSEPEVNGFSRYLDTYVSSGPSKFHIMVNCLGKTYGDIMTGRVAKSSWSSGLIHTDCVRKSAQYISVVPVGNNYLNVTFECDKLCLSFDPSISTASAKYECPNGGRVLPWRKIPSGDCKLPYNPTAKQYPCNSYSSASKGYARLSVLYSTWFLTIPPEVLVKESPSVIKFSLDLKLGNSPYQTGWNRYNLDVVLQFLPYVLEDRCEISPRVGMASATWFSLNCDDLSEFRQKGGFYYTLSYKSALKKPTNVISKQPLTNKLNTAFQIPNIIKPTKVDVSVQVFNVLNNKPCFQTKAVFVLTVEPFVKSRSLDAGINSFPSGDQRVALSATGPLVQGISEFSQRTNALANTLSPYDLQQRRHKNSQRREKMLKAILDIETGSEAQDMKLVKLVNNLTSQRDELTLGVQKPASDNYEKLSKKLMDRSSPLNVKTFSEDLLKGIGSLLNHVSDRGQHFAGQVNNDVTRTFGHVASTLVNSTTIIGKGLFKVKSFAPAHDTIKIPDMVFSLKASNSTSICQKPVKSVLFSRSKPISMRFSCSHEYPTSVGHLAISSLYMLRNPFTIFDLSATMNYPVLSVNIFNKRLSKMVAKSVVLEFSAAKNDFQVSKKIQRLKFTFLTKNASYLIPIYESNFSIPAIEVTGPATSFRWVFINVLAGPFPLDIVVQYGQRPTYTQLITNGFKRDARSNILEEKNNQNYSIFIPSKNGKNDTYFILPVPLANYSLIEATGFISNDTNNTIFVDLEIEIWMKSCLSWDSNQKLWSSNNCRPILEPKKKMDVVKCECRHLSILSANLIVLPNLIRPIDDSYLFLQFFDNPIVFAGLIYVWTLYVCLLYWCRRMDKKNKALAIITVLSNDFTHHIYFVGLRTRWLPRAGTTAKVFLIMYGSESNSTVYYLRDSYKTCFGTGDESWFLLTTDKSIGDLQEVCIWHDDSGSGPDWRLDRVIVQDFETKQIWVLLCSDWISIRTGYKSRYVVLVPLTLEQFQAERLYQFRVQIVEGFRNSHDWLSILLKTPTNNFTHAQRLTCAFNLLLAIMLGNIMFYGIPTDDPKDQIMTGPIEISIKSLVISIETALVLIPVGHFLTKLFSKVSPKNANLRVKPSDGVKIKLRSFRKKSEKYKTSPDTNSRPETGREKGTTTTKNTRTAEADTTDRSKTKPNNKNLEQTAEFASETILEKEGRESPSSKDDSSSSTDSNGSNGLSSHKRSTCNFPDLGLLPWWFVYISWLINIALCIIFTYFTVLYGLKYGQQASYDWVCSFFFAFFQSLFFEQPIEIVLKALFIAVFLSKRIEFGQFGLNTRKMDDEEFLEMIQEHCHFEGEEEFVIAAPCGDRLNRTERK